MYSFVRHLCPSCSSLCVWILKTNYCTHPLFIRSLLYNTYTFFSGMSCRDRVCIVVNVASKWGKTDVNYTELVQLHEKYGPQGLSILAFPCNQFGGQVYFLCEYFVSTVLPLLAYLLPTTIIQYSWQLIASIPIPWLSIITCNATCFWSPGARNRGWNQEICWGIWSKIRHVLQGQSQW